MATNLETKESAGSSDATNKDIPHPSSNTAHTVQSPNPLRVVEFYAGIGGYHCALLDSHANAEIVASIDINTNANQVYAHNFPNTPHLNRNICGITAEELDGLRPDVFFLSPPCQPFTRQGLRRDNQDRRTDSFFHLMHVLLEMKHHPRYILMENVQGFESSQTRDHFVGILQSLDYDIQEFLLSPAQFGVPNSRLRFYLLAKRRPLQFRVKLHEQKAPDSKENEPCRDAEMFKKILTPKHSPFLSSEAKPYAETDTCTANASQPSSVSLNTSLTNFLEPLSEDKLQEYLVPNKVLEKYAVALDIVDPTSDHSCCFTKAYGSYALGTGSILQHSLLPADLAEAFEEYVRYQKSGTERDGVESLLKLNLRYFTPREVANLMCFPKSFSLPETLTKKQCYKVLGNSLNVYVVTVLMRYLFYD